MLALRLRWWFSVSPLPGIWNTALASLGPGHIPYDAHGLEGDQPF
jgi:hypothetical protein